MGATSIFFNGRLIRRPGSYSEVDASGLETVGLGANGIVALIGTSEGGRPASTITKASDLLVLNKPEKVRAEIRSGDLLEAGTMIFEPGSDPNILAGAQQVVFLKVNPATQSTGTLSNGDGAALDLTTLDYGAFTEQVNVSLATGTSLGKLLTIRFEDTTETVDNLGGLNIYTLLYDGAADTWETMTSSVAAGGITATGTRSDAGEFSFVTTPIVAGSTARIVSTNAGDIGQSVTIYGISSTNTPQRETLVLNGTTVVPGVLLWNQINGVEISAAHAGTVEVRDNVTVLFPIVFDVPTGFLREGVQSVQAMFCAGLPLSVVADGATTDTFVVWGKSASGATVSERFVLTGAVPVVGAVVFAQIDKIITGNVVNARTVTITAVAVQTLNTVQNTVTKAKDYFNAKKIGALGFTFTLVTGNTIFKIADLDYVTAVNVFAVTAGFKADLFAVIDWINQNSVLVSAARAAPGTGVPSNTVIPLFLSGGGEGTTLFSHWQSALNLLKQKRVNSVVVMTADPAVAAALNAHCTFMCGIGRSERDGFVGVLNGALTGLATKTEIKTQIVALNSRHIRAFAQNIERFNTEGERTTFNPAFAGVIAAGMQAGSPVGTSLTSKLANILAIESHNTWNPTDDAEEMIEAGLCFLENLEGVGRRFVRNITTHLSTSNIAFTEGSVNEAVNFATFNFRTNMEFAVGQKGNGATILQGRSVAHNTLGLLVDEEVLVAFRALDIDIVVDVMEVSVEIAPVIPINFVKNTIHLVTIRQTA